MDSLNASIKSHLTGLVEKDGTIYDFKYLLAVSGGMDSMVMAHCFQSLGLEFGVAHFNFQLRGQASELDAELVRTYCSKNNIDIYLRSEDTKKTATKNKQSIQESARELRYEFFDNIMDSHEFDFTCTAHHANDNIETFFIHLLRGSGLKGLTGIPSKRDRFIRPMLRVPKDILVNYATKHQIDFREDVSNKSDKYLRNFIRHHIIQPLAKKDKNYLSGILKSMDHVHENQKFIDFQVKMFYETYVINYTSDIQSIPTLSDKAHDSGLSHILKMYLLSQKLYPDSLTNLFGFTQPWKTGTVYEGESVNAWYDRDQLFIIRDSFFSDWDKEDIVELSLGSSIELPGGDKIKLSEKPPDSESVDSTMIFINIESDSFPLKVRHWSPGDVIEQGAPPYFHKSLKKIFNDHQIPRPFKHRIYILTDNYDNIISVLGLANNPKYTSTTDSDLTIRYMSQLSFLFDTDPNRD